MRLVFAGERMRFNPFGPGMETVKGGLRIRELLKGGISARSAAWIT